MLINKLCSALNRQAQTQMDFFYGIVFILLVPAIAQILYSFLELNFTDHGFIFAESGSFCLENGNAGIITYSEDRREELKNV